MADVSDVEAAFVTAVATALFGGTTYTPGTLTASTPAGCSIAVARGWPVAQTLDTFLGLGQAVVSVFPQANSSRDTTRYQLGPQVISTAAITFAVTLNAAANVVTFSGTCSTSQVVGLTVGGTGYAYRMLANDTPATVAAAFATMIPNCTVSGAVLSLIPQGKFTYAAVVSDTTQIIEVRRQTQVFLVSIWAPTPAIRDLIGATIEPAIAQIRSLALPDGTGTDIIKYRGSFTDDVVQKDNLWKRTLRYETEYPTTVTAIDPAMMFLTGNVITAGGAAFSFGTLQPGAFVMMDTLGNVIVDSTQNAFTSIDGVVSTITGPITDQAGNTVTTGYGFVTNK